MVFPVVSESDNVPIYFSLWLRKFAENIWYLLFFTGETMEGSKTNKQNPCEIWEGHSTHFSD
jgi:hypothetical protein